MEFKAEDINGHLVIKPVIEKKGNDIIVHVPSFVLIEKLKRELGKGDNNGVRRIQSL